MRMNLRKLPLMFCVAGMLFWMFAGLLPVYASAAEPVGSLTMFCQTQEGIILSDVDWDIHRIGYRAEDGSFQLNKDFYYPVSLADTSKSAISEAAQTLAGYCVSDKLKPLDKQTSDAQGKVKFEELPYGLYLLIGGLVKEGEVYYIYSPFIIEIPSPDSKDVDIIAYPKAKMMSWTEESYEYTLKKIWSDDDDFYAARPISITAKIYRDGAYYQSVVLNESNQWTYSWHSNTLNEWTIVEENVPRDYAVVYNNNGFQFVIVNTFDEELQYWKDQPLETSVVITETTTAATTTTETATTTEVSTATETSATATAQMSETTSTTTTTTTTTTTKTTTKKPQKPEKLPQTGQLWWPVPVLAIAGVVLTALGLKLRNKE